MKESNLQKYQIVPSEQYIADINKLKKSGQKLLISKIIAFLEEIKEEPTTGTGQVEQLKFFGERSIWSRRINQKHRLVYEVFEEEKKIELLSAYGHYNDK